jgi:Right handed beta helix region/Protein of unknown function (DUF1565)
MRSSFLVCASLVCLLAACGGSGSSGGTSAGSAAAAPARDATDSAADLFVATDGDDSNPGTSDRPLRSVQKAIDGVKRGQTVLVRAGVYREGRLTIDRQDDGAQPITFKAEPGVVLDYSLPVLGWQAEGGGVYSTLPQYEFADVGKWNNMVVVGERPLRRVWRRDEMQPGTFFADAGSGVVYVWADGGIDPGSVTTLVMNFYNFGLRISGRTRNLVFDGFTHRGGEVGIRAGERDSTTIGRQLTLKNCTIEFHYQYAVEFNSWDGAEIDNCTVRHAGLVNWPRGRFERDDNGVIQRNAGGQPIRTNWPHAIIGWNGDNISVRRSRIFDNHGEGIGPYLDCEGWKIVENTVFDNYSIGIYADTNDGDVLIDRNLVFMTSADKFAPGPDGANPGFPGQDGIRIANEKRDLLGAGNDPAVRNIRVTNNIVVGVFGGIQSFNYNDGPFVLKDSLIAHNTVVGAAPAANGDFALLVSPGQNVRVHNNIVLGGRLGVSGSGAVASNNLVQDGSKVAAWSGAAVNDSVFGDPGFIVGSGNDAAGYGLAASSRARGAGVVLGEVGTDFFGNVRAAGVAPDLGAVQARP